MRTTALTALTLALALQPSCAGEPSGTTEPQDTTVSSPTEPSGAGSANRLRAMIPWPELNRAPSAIGGGEKDAVVIVAVESYDYVPPVPGATSNGTAWHTYFTEGLEVPPAHVRLLTNADATKEAIESALDHAAGQAEAGGRVWFVFVGHGGPSGDGKDGLLLGADVRQTAISLDSRGVRHSDAIARLERSVAQPVVILDACFSGRTGSGDAVIEGLQPVRLVDIAAPVRAVVLSAAGSDQYAGPLPGRARPAFSYLVLGALRGWGDADRSGDVTAGEALAYASKAMAAVVSGRTQRPELAGSGAQVLAPSGSEAGPELAVIQRALAQGSDIAFNSGGVVMTDLPKLQLGDVTRGDLAGEVDLRRIDIEAEKRMETQYLALQSAKRKVDAARAAGKNDPSGTKQEKAWCELAQLEEPNPYRKEANNACTQMRTYVEQRKRLVTAMVHDWEATVVPFMQLQHRSVADKKKVMNAFVNAYGMLDERAEIASGKQALALLHNKKVPAFKSRGGVSVVREPPMRAGTGEMLLVAGGRFDGHLIEAFEMDRTEVTVAAYRACVHAGACETPDDAGRSSNYGKPGRDKHPVNEVSALDADAFCRWARKRLPTEWEWEWAARGRDEAREYPWGSMAPSCSLAVAVSDPGGNGCGRHQTYATGSLPDGASRDGLMNMAGNVAEWTASTNGDERVLRGGSWFAKAHRYFLVSSRESKPPSYRGLENGFRCARDAD